MDDYNCALVSEEEESVIALPKLQDPILKSLNPWPVLLLGVSEDIQLVVEMSSLRGSQCVNVLPG